VKLWISEHDFIELDDRESLTAEIAPRSRSLDWLGIVGFLPDPDVVLRKLGQDISTYRLLLSDAHVWSCYESRTSGALSCDWKVAEAAEGGSARANKRAYELIQTMMKRLDVHQVIEDMLQAPFFGMSPIEVIWSADTTLWVPERVVGKPPEWFGFTENNELRFRSRENMYEGEEIPEYKFLLPRHHATYQNPYGERILSRCFWPVAFKKGGFKFWAIFTEKYGMPWVRGKVPRGTNETERAKLLSRLVSMVQDAVAVINDDESVEITEASGKQASASIYERLISAGNRECSKAILGQTLSTELDKGGSFAATKGHLEVRDDLIDADKRMVSSSWNQLFQWVTQLNIDGAAPPTFSFIEEEDIQEDRAKRDKDLFEQGVDFTEKYYMRTYNLEEDDIAGINRETRIRGFSEFAKTQSRFDPEQEELEELADDSLGLATEAWKGIDGPIRKLIESSSSLEEVRDRIFEVYRDLDPEDLEKLVRDALVTAALAGAADGAKGRKKRSEI
jgi:phage gp29-like protein